MNGDTLYRKVKGKYVEAGIMSHIDLYPGVWLVQKTKGGCSMQGICLSELPTISSLVEVVQAKLIAQILTAKLIELVDAGSLEIYNRAIGQLEHDFADAIVEHLNQGREMAVKGGYDVAKATGIELARKTMGDLLRSDTTLTKLQRLIYDIQETGFKKVGTHEFVWYLSELRVMLRDAGFDLKNTSIAGMVVNPEIEE